MKKLLLSVAAITLLMAGQAYSSDGTVTVDGEEFDLACYQAMCMYAESEGKDLPKGCVTVLEIYKHDLEENCDGYSDMCHGCVRSKVKRDMKKCDEGEFDDEILSTMSKCRKSKIFNTEGSSTSSESDAG